MKKNWVRSGLLSSALGLGLLTNLQAATVYNLDLGAGTLNGNPLTSVMIFESGEGQVNLDFPYTFPGSGPFTVTSTSAFQATTALIVGLDLPSSTGGDNKTHLLFFTNDAFAQAANGILFSVAFPNSRHNDFITRLLAAEGGDATQLAWLTNFFLTGDGASAAFAPGTQPTAVEFTAGVVIPPTPEPGTFAFAAIGLIALIAIGRRRLVA